MRDAIFLKLSNKYIYYLFKDNISFYVINSTFYGVFYGSIRIIYVG